LLGVVEDQLAALAAADDFPLAHDGGQIALELQAGLALEFGIDRGQARTLARQPVDRLEIALVAVREFQGETGFALAGEARSGTSAPATERTGRVSD
jgi:hypothetical protein